MASQTASAPAIQPSIVALSLLGAFSAIYAPLVGHGFIKDDFEWIADSRIDSLAGISRVLLRAPSGFYRPAVSLSFAWNGLVCGSSSRCYGLTNFGLAIACACAVYALARALRRDRGVALLAAALWAFNWHGVNMAQLWISGRTALLVVLFGTLSAAAFASGRFVLAAVLVLVALFAKEEAVLLPLILLGWAMLDRSMGRSWPRRGLVVFGCASAVSEALYFFLRLRSGAFTPASAPSFYQFTFAPAIVARNLLQYLDRTATCSVAALLLSLLVGRLLARGHQPRGARQTDDRSVITFGLIWWIVTLAMTVALPVRSSLYACLPSVGICVMTAAIIASRWPSLSPRAARRATVAAMALPFLLWPLYRARATPLTNEADLSAHTIETLQRIAATKGAGTVVLIHDDPVSRLRMINPFGAFLQSAVDLLVFPRIVVWIDPPPGEVVAAQLAAPSHVDEVLFLRDGLLVREPNQ